MNKRSRSSCKKKNLLPIRNKELFQYPFSGWSGIVWTFKRNNPAEIPSVIRSLIAYKRAFHGSFRQFRNVSAGCGSRRNRGIPRRCWDQDVSAGRTASSSSSSFSPRRINSRGHGIVSGIPYRLEHGTQPFGMRKHQSVTCQGLPAPYHIRRDRNGCLSFRRVYTRRLTMGERVNHPKFPRFIRPWIHSPGWVSYIGTSRFSCDEKLVLNDLVEPRYVPWVVSNLNVFFFVVKKFLKFEGNLRDRKVEQLLYFVVLIWYYRWNIKGLFVSVETNKRSG